MLKKTALVAAFSGCLLSAHAEVTFPGFDAARATFSYADDMDLSDDEGSLSVAQANLFSLLSKPITPFEGLSLIPAFEYELTSLDFDGVGNSYPIDDEDLHSLNLSLYALSMQEGCPWIYGAWGRAKMNSDFQHVDGDDFTFDVAAGVGYRFNKSFTLGVGVAVANLNGDARFYPGINFDWIVNDQFRVGAYGPSLIADYSVGDDWIFSLRGETGGGVWNISDDDGNSRAIDLSSYNLSLMANRRLTGDLWLSAGAGYTFGNEIRLTETDGDKLRTDDLDGGLFATVGLRLKTW